MANWRRRLLDEIRWTNRLMVAQIEAKTLGADPTLVVRAWRKRNRTRAKRAKK